MTDNGETTGGKPGAPLRNKNAMRHGLRASTLPKGAERIYYDLLQFRRQLENYLLSQDGGEIGIYEDALIQSAFRHEKRARLAEKWLRDNPDSSLMDRLALLKEASNASDQRDKCLQRLGLDKLDIEQNGIPSVEAIEAQNRKTIAAYRIQSGEGTSSPRPEDQSGEQETDTDDGSDTDGCQSIPDANLWPPSPSGAGGVLGSETDTD